jgi:hypothetical protein
MIPARPHGLATEFADGLRQAAMGTGRAVWPAGSLYYFAGLVFVGESRICKHMESSYDALCKLKTPRALILAQRIR